MTEDYVRRVLPTKWAVDVAKLQERNVTDIISVLVIYFRNVEICVLKDLMMLN
jgi:hypothetical protein